MDNERIKTFVEYKYKSAVFRNGTSDRRVTGFLQVSYAGR
jgi:hypothetical protein